MIDYDKDRDLLLSERVHHAFTNEMLTTLINWKASPLRVGKSPLGYQTIRMGFICCRVAGDPVDTLSQPRLSMQNSGHQVTFLLRRRFFQGAQLPAQSGEMLSNRVAEHCAQPLSFDWRMP